MTYKTVNCPVCKTKCLERSLKLHIINKGKNEAENIMNKLLENANNKLYTFSPIALLQRMPHIAYIRRNVKIKKILKK